MTDMNRDKNRLSAQDYATLDAVLAALDMMAAVYS